MNCLCVPSLKNSIRTAITLGLYSVPRHFDYAVEHPIEYTIILSATSFFLDALMSTGATIFGVPFKRFNIIANGIFFCISLLSFMNQILTTSKKK